MAEKGKRQLVPGLNKTEGMALGADNCASASADTGEKNKSRKGKDYELYDCKRQTYSTDKQQGRGAPVNYQRREGVPVAGAMIVPTTAPNALPTPDIFYSLV